MHLDPYPLESTPGEPTAPREPVTVAPGHPCRRCGYELGGLPIAGRCPECGAPVERSLRGNLLELASPAYLRRLHAGALLVELGVVVICAVPIGGVAGMIIVLISPWSRRLLDLLPLAGALMAVAAGLLGLIGWFVLTGRDPAHIGPDESDRARLTTRIATIACSACWLIMAAVSYAPTLAAAAPGRFATLMGVSGVVLAAAVCVHAVASMAYLRHLAQRVPDAELAAGTRVSRGLAIGWAIAAALTAVLAGIGRGGLVAGLFGLVAFVAFLAFLVRYADAVDKMRRNLSRLGGT